MPRTRKSGNAQCLEIARDQNRMAAPLCTDTSDTMSVCLSVLPDGYKSGLSGYGVLNLSRWHCENISCWLLNSLFTKKVALDTS